MLDGSVLETERLILRPTSRGDLDGWTAFVGDPEAQRFLGGAQPRHGAWRQLLGTAGSWALQGFGMFSVIEKATSRWIGRVGPIHHADWPGTEIGWGLARETWGRGYATEAATAAMDFAVHNLGWVELIHCIDPDNTASQAVARRLGSAIVRQAHLPPPFADTPVDVWGQTAEDWLSRRR